MLEVLNSNKDPVLESFEQQRFQLQLLTDKWNSQIMVNEDEVSPCEFDILLDCLNPIFLIVVISCLSSLLGRPLTAQLRCCHTIYHTSF